MNRLLGAELRRAVHRRVTAGVGLMLIGLALFAVWGQHQQGQSFGDGRAAATASYQSAHADWVQNHVQQEKDCAASVPADVRKANPGMCSQPEPKLEDFLPFGGSFKQISDGGLDPMLAMLLFGTFTLGASLVCAEFTSGALSNWLTFSPRRTPVYLSKLLAGAVVGFVLSVVAVIVCFVGLALVAKGFDVAVPGPKGSELFATWGRATVLGVIGAVLGAAIGFITRHTAAAIGALVTYLIAVEMMLRGAISGFQRWMVSTNVAAFVKHGTNYFTDKCVTLKDSGMTCKQVPHHVSFEAGSGYLLVLLMVVGALGCVAFTRRDVN